MNKPQLQRFVRTAYEELPDHCQDRIAMRMFGGPVFAWDYLTSAQLRELWGLVRGQALIWEVHA